MSTTTATATTIDESLYSRQLYVMGKFAMVAMKDATVIISGIDGCGIEIAKCLVLSGIGNIILHDRKVATSDDIYSNYYISPKHIATNTSRAAAVRDSLSKLNPYVTITIHTGSLSEYIVTHKEQLRENVVIACDDTMHGQLHISDMCHNYNIKYIFASTWGIVGSIFCDFGNSFTVHDINGEDPLSGIIISHTNNICTTLESHDLSSDSVIAIHDTQYRIKVLTNTTFVLLQPDNGSSVVIDNGTQYTEIKQPKTFNFKSMANSLSDATFSDIIEEDFERQQKLHRIMTSISSSIWMRENYITDDNVAALYDTVISNFPDTLLPTTTATTATTDLIKNVISTLNGKFAPLESVIASIAAQEAIKSITHKFTPIHQWLYYDVASIINHDTPTTDPTPIDARYNKQVTIIGKDMQNALSEESVFVVGAGAIGCEILKLLSLIGIGCIHVTDMDTIEKSNLNRQFLFTNKSLGKFKSECATAAIKKFNDTIETYSYTQKIAPETLDFFNDEFFQTKTMVLTALDNIQARLFVDKMCVKYEIPLVDSGTLGTKGNVQVMIPSITEPYGASSDIPEKSIPMCTLKNFPYMIEHTIQWARSLFEGLFTKAPTNYMHYKATATLPDNDDEIKDSITFIHEYNAASYNECIIAGYRMWKMHFHDPIVDITRKFPKDHMENEDTLFWSGTRTFPQVVSPLCDESVDTIISFGALWATVFGIDVPVTTSRTTIKKVIEKAMRAANAISVTNATLTIPNHADLDYDTTIVEFDKDNDIHIDFVTNASNLRAKIYNIAPADNLKTKGIAGKIIPAIITSTVLTSSLAVIEYIKIIKSRTTTTSVTPIPHTNSFINLATATLCFSDPIMCKKTTIGTLEYTLWSIPTLANDTLTNIIKKITHMIGDDTLRVATISVGQFTLYDVDVALKKSTAVMTIRQLCETVCKLDNVGKDIELSVLIESKNDGETSEIMPCRITMT